MNTFSAMERLKAMFSPKPVAAPEENVTLPVDEGVRRLHEQILAAVPDAEKLNCSVFTSSVTKVHDVEKLEIILDITQKVFRVPQNHLGSTTSYDLRRLTGSSIESMRDYQANSAAIATGQCSLRDLFHAREEIVDLGIKPDSTGVYRALSTHARMNEIMRRYSKHKTRVMVLQYYASPDLVSAVEKHYEQGDRVIEYFLAEDASLVNKILTNYANARRSGSRHAPPSDFHPQHLEDYLHAPQALAQGVL